MWFYQDFKKNNSHVSCMKCASEYCILLRSGLVKYILINIWLIVTMPLKKTIVPECKSRVFIVHLKRSHLSYN